jgi:hypothetical protein
MAIDAYVEAVGYKDEPKHKQPKLHDYAKPESNWADDYNKGLPSKIKINDIDIIEEDIENEMDSEYSMTIKKNCHAISDVRNGLDLDLDESVTTSRDNSDNENFDFDTDDLEEKNSMFSERRRSRKDRKLSIT